MRINLKIEIMKKYRNQYEFARAVKMSESRLSKIITGRDDPTDTEKRAILRKLGIENSGVFENISVGVTA